MPAIRPRLCKLTFALLAGASVAVACSVDDAGMEMPGCSGLSCTTDRGPPADPTNVESGATGAPDASADPPSSPAKAECGPGSCLPDDGNACADYSPPEPPRPPEVDAGAPEDAGSPAEPADAGISDAGPDGPSIDGSFAQPARPAPGPARFACQVGVGPRGVARVCGVAGSQAAEQACTSSLDCAPGLGCVGPAGSGRCLQYCCGVGSDDSCADGFYCAQRPLHDGTGGANAPLVPVCDRADDCSLGEQANCTGPGCVCGPSSACMTVRPGGTTACVALTPNPGQAGDPCPCDRGYHCSQAEPATCVKTCDLDAKDSDTCGSGVCQASPALPTGWGICVGAAPEQMTSP